MPWLGSLQLQYEFSWCTPFSVRGYKISIILIQSIAIFASNWATLMPIVKDKQPKCSWNNIQKSLKVNVEGWKHRHWHNKYDFDYEPSILNFLRNKSTVSHPKRMTIINACTVRTLFHLKCKCDNDWWPTPIRGITPKSWPIANNGQMALRKVPSKPLFLSKMHSKFLFFYLNFAFF